MFNFNNQKYRVYSPMTRSYYNDPVMKARKDSLQGHFGKFGISIPDDRKVVCRANKTFLVLFLGLFLSMTQGFYPPPEKQEKI